MIGSRRYLIQHKSHWTNCKCLKRKLFIGQTTFLWVQLKPEIFLLLPLMIGDVTKENMDDETWKNYIRLLRIPLLIISPYVSIETVLVETLKQVIYSSLYNFMKLHREVPVFPKLHYLVHLSGQILQFGSGRSHMCTRHGLFKNKSVSLSVALHHQRWMCLRQCGFGSEKPMFTCMEVTKFRMDVKF